jgi:hypothetical protein
LKTVHLENTYYNLLTLFTFYTIYADFSLSSFNIYIYIYNLGLRLGLFWRFGDLDYFFGDLAIWRFWTIWRFGLFLAIWRFGDFGLFGDLDYFLAIWRFGDFGDLDDLLLRYATNCYINSFTR